MKHLFDQLINEMHFRICKSKKNLAIFAYDNNIHGVTTGSKLFHDYEQKPDAVLIGVYNKHIPKIELSADISMVVDEWLDEDE